MKKRSLKKYVIFPCCILIFGVIEELATYMSELIPNDHVRVSSLMVFFAFGISIIAYVFTPMIERFFFRLHAVSKFGAGRLGDTFFVLILLSLVYFLWYVVLVHGPENLLPPSWR
ncbi:hypothetical protein G0Q06_10750 [Puniceicoccales bacterium CK1056]|uniref:Uncharacterized protein n=1 Tax=Oceanipulchritudo coccoides TaxID=2706888 RepID=A0A6B2M1P6_9BACT|nr:hypothetical protein [Oceanipulchritudo coccoides]NDV62931.1 hypothetical protein [Oceanipulchritudo coccoides]